MSDSELKLPSSYDYFYFDHSILKEFQDLASIETFSKSELKLDFFQNIRGFSYLIELILIDIIDHVEGLVKNQDVFDVLHWSESSINEDAIRKLTESEPLIKYVFELNGIRKDFSRIRTKQRNISEADINNWKIIFLSFIDKLEEIDIFLRKDLKIEQKRTDTKPSISNWFQVKYSYIEGDCEDILNWDESKIISSYPGGTPFFYTMPNETRKTYHLEHPLIKNHFKEYLTGYKIALVYFYKTYLTKEQYKQAKEKILSAKIWNDIHKAYGLIIRLTEKEKERFNPIFEITDKEVVKEIVTNSTITEKHELDLIFRRINNLRIKTIRNDSDIGEWGNHSLFYHILFGAKYIQQENIEVLEFKQEFEDQAMIEYSYAIFIPIMSSISDGSYWIFFDRVALSSTKDSYKSTSKYMVDGYIKLLKEKFDYNIKSYHLKGDLLKEYIKNKDFEERKKYILNEKVKTSKGLLGQFIAYLFLAKVHDAKLIDISKNIGSTDIDIIAENNSSVFLVQAKSKFPITKKSVEELTSHFEKIKDHVKTNKSLRKILFLIEESTEDDFEYMIENNLDGLSNDDVENRVDVKQELSKEDIEIFSYKELKNKLKGKEYTDFLSKVDGVFDYFDFDQSFDF